jgi:hypothetical protein
MQSIKIRVTRLEVDGAPFEAPFGAAFVTTFGPHDRHTDSVLTSAPGGKLDRNHFLRTHICDSTGIVYYIRHPELILTHCYFSFVTDDTPMQPHSPFAGWIEINGLRLNSEVVERDVPREGETPITQDWKSIYYNGPAFRVDFDFTRPRNKLGKRAGRKRLANVSISFRGLEQDDKRNIPRVEVHRNDAIELEFQHHGNRHYVWLDGPSSELLRPLYINAERVTPNSERAKELLANIDLWWNALPAELRARVTEIATRSVPLLQADHLTKEAIHLSPVLRLREYLQAYYLG